MTPLLTLTVRSVKLPAWTDARCSSGSRSGKLVEGPEHASEDYVKGLARTLIVSGDTELISAPAYLKAAEHAPRLQSYVSVVGIIQDELGHAHIAYRMLRDLGVDTDALIYEREPVGLPLPVRVRRPARELVGDGRRERLLRPRGLRPAQRHLRAHDRTARGSARSSRSTARRRSTSGTASAG